MALPCALTVYAECSEQGVCNAVTGVCDCAKGYHGITCDDRSDNEDKHVFSHDGPFFTASVVKINAVRAPSPDFNIFSAAIGTRNVTTIRGDLRLIHSGEAQFERTLILGGSAWEIPDHDADTIMVGYGYGKEILNMNNRGRLRLTGGIDAGKLHCQLS
jgi:hypothetical protein